MSERYSKLFSLPENLYAVGSPIVVAAGTLLKDNQTGKIVAQLKLRSISPKTIIGVKVRLSLFNNAGNSIGESVVYDYLDLNASRDTEFGQKTPVLVAEIKARAYTVAVQEVVFMDKTTWTASKAEWEPLPHQKTLGAVLHDQEMVKQYKIAVGSNFSYYPLEEKDLWYCACGALNHEGEACHECHRTLFELQTIDLKQLVKDKDDRLAQETAATEAKAAEERATAEAAKRKTAKVLKIVIPVLCAVVAVVLLVTNVIIPNGKYNDAVSLMVAGEYEEAIAAFEAMNGYKDSIDQIAACETAILDNKYNNAVALMDAGQYKEAIIAFGAMNGYKDSIDQIAACETAILDPQYRDAIVLMNAGKTAEAAIAFCKVGDYKDAKEQSMQLWNIIVERETISVDNNDAVGLKANGTVVAVGNNNYGQSNVADWTDIVEVSLSNAHTVGLKSDGTVVAVGYNVDGQCNVSNWTDIVAVSAGASHTVGLKADGTVVAVGQNGRGQCNVSGWTDIIAVSAGDYHTVGLKIDGTVVAVGVNVDGQCNVVDWVDIIAIYAGDFHTVGLKSDGTVVAVGYNDVGQCNVFGWTDIVAVSASHYHTVGLKADGTVVAVGHDSCSQCSVSSWTDIVAVSAGFNNTIGLKADGTVVTVGSIGRKQLYDWKNIKLP